MDKQKKTQYDIQYQKDHLKRIPLNVRLEEYEKIKEAAGALNEPVNTFIKKAIQDRINSIENN